VLIEPRVPWSVDQAQDANRGAVPPVVSPFRAWRTVTEPLLAAIAMDEHTSVAGSILRPQFTSDKFLALKWPQQGFQQQIDTSLDNFGHRLYNTMHDSMMQRLSDMQTGPQNDLNALNDRFSQMSTSEQYQQIYDQQTQLQNNVNALNTAFGDFRDHFYHYYPAPARPPQFCPLRHSILLRRRLRMTRPFGI
jgi:hypothetical protein